jgi:ABC-2 type transport system permease protein
MNKNNQYAKFWWIPAVLVLVALVFVSDRIYLFKLDLTEEKRFKLYTATRNLLSNLKEPVKVQVFLDGDMPAGFKKLSNASKALLNEFRNLSKSNLTVEFKRPGEGMDEEEGLRFKQYIDSLGLKPTNVKVTAKAGESAEERLLYAGALVSAGGNDLIVDLLQGQSATGGYEALNNAEALLEYKFASAIHKLTREEIPVIGYLTGNGQPLTYNVYDLIENTLRPNYGFAFVPIDSFPVLPLEFDALMIVKPTVPFTDRQKIKLDQYVMNGGKLLFFIDNLYAEMDSLMRAQSDFVAFDRGLNLDDLLFRYGVRINMDLVQDLHSDKIPLVVGNFGNEPQMQLVPWPYFPLLNSSSGHPISKNLNDVLSIFPNSIDTIEQEGVKKTILLNTTPASRSLATPAIVSLNSVKTEDDLKTFNKGEIPVAVLLEGTFTSLYRNRISAALRDSLNNYYNMPFMPSSVFTKMIVVSDADIALNVFSPQEGPLPMGYNQFTGMQYANKDFILNSIEYLVDPNQVLQARAKDITLRLLDVKKIESERSFWQMINIGLPIVILVMFGGIYNAIRKKKYGN